MSAEKNFTGRLAPSIAEVLAGRDRDEKGRIPAKWTIENALKEASKYKTKKEFRLKSNSAYQYLVRKKSLYLISGMEEGKRHRVSDWDVICAIKSCQSRSEMMRRFYGEYCAVPKRDHLKSIYQTHFGRGKTTRYWTKEKAILEAKKYNFRSDFCRKSSGAYEYVMNNGLAKLAFSHMQRPLSDFDVVYLWTTRLNGRLAAKVGVTSRRLGMERIKSVSEKSSLEPIDVFVVSSGIALKAENKIKKIGTPCGVSGFNGCSELFFVSCSDLQKIKRIMRWISSDQRRGLKNVKAELQALTQAQY